MARTCMFENLREGNQAEINAREEENTNQMKRRVEILSSSEHTFRSTLTILFKDFKAFQRLSKSSFSSVQSSTLDTLFFLIFPNFPLISREHEAAG